MVSVLNRELDADASAAARDLHDACLNFVRIADAYIPEKGNLWAGDATSLADIRGYVNSLGLFLSSRVDGELVSTRIPDDLLVQLAEILNKTVSSVKEGKGTLQKLLNRLPGLRGELIDWLARVKREADPSATKGPAWRAFVENFESYLTPDYKNYLSALTTRLNYAESEAFRMKAELHELESKKARDDQRQAAGHTGASQLAQHFDDLSRAEARSESNYMMFFAGCLVVITGIGVWILTAVHDSDWKTIAIRAGLSLPIIAAATYVAKIAGRHREAKFWTRTAAVQLKTIGAYTSAIDDEKLRGSIYSTLGQSVFANPELARKADGQANFLPLDVVELVKLVTERAKTSA
ncbi:hypothetical protein JO861_24210 [Rhodococcus hoagii]|uniref:hypothetical protein n=1 Tax=Rhodococcus hoagii TaxID=43767 RepID=UPI0019650019|nr:hypothetical protein [Prescottella equi]MBM9839659.1 hypothetical protein [Prescottella equi]